MVLRRDSELLATRFGCTRDQSKLIRCHKASAIRVVRSITDGLGARTSSMPYPVMESDHVQPVGYRNLSHLDKNLHVLMKDLSSLCQNIFSRAASATARAARCKPPDMSHPVGSTPCDTEVHVSHTIHEWNVEHNQASTFRTPMTRSRHSDWRTGQYLQGAVLGCA